MELQNVSHNWLMLMLGIVIKLEISCSSCCISIIIACQLALLYRGTFHCACL